MAVKDLPDERVLAVDLASDLTIAAVYAPRVDKLGAVFAGRHASPLRKHRSGGPACCGTDAP